MARSTYAAVVLALSLAAVCSAVPAAVRPIDANSRLLKYGPESQAWVSSEALDFLRDTDIDLSLPKAALRQQYPVIAPVPDALIDILGNHNSPRGPGFLDVTEIGDADGARTAKENDVTIFAFPTPSKSKYPIADSLFSQINANSLKSTVTTLSGYSTRYYRSSGARAPATWIQSQFASAAGSANVKLIENSFDQPNVIATIPAKSGGSSEVVILGAHLDSINQRSTTSAAPGADDDASGIAILLQALQILTAAGWKGSRPIEFHAYAGEEGGMLGSATVASQYKKAGRAVRAMLNFDMVAYQPTSKPVVTVLTDTTADLATFSRSLISAYIPEATLATNKCGYACSDHFSWYNQGYATISIDESGPSDTYLNPNYHTANDTVDKLDFTKASAFVKLAIAWILELSE